MRDDLGKTFELPRTAKKYARLSGKLGTSPAKAQLYIDMVADLTGQQDRKSGFANKDASGEVPHAFKDSAESVARTMLEDEDEIGTLATSGMRPSVIDVKFEKAGWKEVDLPADIIAQFVKHDWYGSIDFLLGYLNSTYRYQFGWVDELGNFDHLYPGGKHPAKVHGRTDPIRPL